MKIKTIIYKVNKAGMADFDKEVNEATAEGWRLVKREVLPGVDLGSAYFEPHLYAELVQLDEPEAPPEPQPVDPFDALRVIRDFCAAHNKCGGCQLDEWCGKHLAGNEGPADWHIPGEEAGR